MIGLDTNVLVRYLVRDDLEQASRARRAIEQSLSADNPGYISLVALVELSWVLERSYRLSPAELADVLYGLLASEVFLLQNELEVHIAYRRFREGHGFSDALIDAVNSSAGCAQTLTFDRRASRLPGFELL
jgi:predicted nucleic-acid-binding protein